MRYLAPTALVQAIGHQAEPFGAERIELLNKLSRKILSSPALRSDDASLAFAFWLRPGSINDIRTHYLSIEGQYGDSALHPVGSVFHIAPGNVETMFLYSWALSFLSGNFNVVRVSSRGSPILDGLLECLNALMEEAPWVASENQFCTYPRENLCQTEQFSATCDLRVVWGGDETIRRIRAIPLNPHASERWFSSKYSLAVVHAKPFLSLDAENSEKVVEQLYNDIFPFDQMACSSPHAICWIGNQEDGAAAFAGFRDVLAKVVERKKHVDHITNAVHRYTHAFAMAAEGAGRMPAENHGCLHMDCFSEDFRRDACGAGFLSHYSMATLEDLGALLQSRDQTVVHYGFSDPEVHAFACLAARRGVDRIVPLGASLDFHFIWDGFDLVRDFSKLIHVVT